MTTTQKTTAHLTAMWAAALCLAGTAAMAQQELYAENFAAADADGSGWLTLAEFTTFIDLNAEDGLGRASTIQQRAAYATAFSRVDANGNGTIEHQELQAMQR